MAEAPYKPAPLFPRPPQLDPAQYDASPQQRAAEAERVAIRSRLKRHYLLELNDPRRTSIVSGASRGARAARPKLRSDYNSHHSLALVLAARDDGSCSPTAAGERPPGLGKKAALGPWGPLSSV
uniref:NADH dehydrogenase [ubiquinone] 1 beta subcomplex subunit 4-like n=1 Tax=Podarcis muralis TaxID=64176 RepID=UPI00109F0859|nr:NADH dehydrogenase [ubiquinone] 1 beta subcomplex subunit 4-like [Podarcis muralis]